VARHPARGVKSRLREVIEMVTEPPQYDPAGGQPHAPGPPQPPPPAAALPPVTDRRAPERRSRAPRVGELRPEDRTQFARTAAAAAMAFCGGLFVLFVFFWALGAIDVTDAVAATAVAVVLALIWLGGFLYRRGQEEPELIRRDRERRGF
jgi:hypothetical protein